jgi:hypothetical protein
MTFEEWFAEISKVTTFFHAGVCKSLAIAAWEAATKAEREACAKVCEDQIDGYYERDRLSNDVPWEASTIGEIDMAMQCAAAIRSNQG